MDLPNDPFSRTNSDAYLVLRSAIRKHIDEQSGPILTKCTKPVGGYNWQPQPDSVQDMDLYCDGDDPLALATDFQLQLLS